MRTLVVAAIDQDARRAAVRSHFPEGDFLLTLHVLIFAVNRNQPELAIRRVNRDGGARCMSSGTVVRRARQ